MKRLRVFLIGYEAPGWDPSEPTLVHKARIVKLMDAVDVGAVLPNGWPIGKVLDLEDGIPFVCIEHEQNGKIAIVRPVEAES